MQQESFGPWLKRKRRALNLTQAELAARVGCSAAAIRKFEAEERHPSRQISSLLAQVLDIPQEEQPAFHRFARGELLSMPMEQGRILPWQGVRASARSNLPAAVTSLVGREAGIAHVRAELLDPGIRLLSLIGPPGIGKTRLGIETARATLPHFPDGVFFIALAVLDEPAQVVFSLLQSLGFVGAMHVPAREQLIDGIGQKQMLLVLDNCEHLVDEVAGLVSGLLSSCPHLKILVTSRESLRIPGEWQYVVPPLQIPDEVSSLAVDEAAAMFPALALFHERARAVHAGFSLNADNLVAVASICARLDGLPLAIELMAARIRFMTPQVLLERMEGDFVLSADGLRALSPRQKTLNDAIGWSYRLLSEHEQMLFACLSVFPGSFPLQAAEVMFSPMFPPRSVSILATSLFDKSLLQRVMDEEGGIHFSMLATIRQFAADRLEQMELTAEVRQAHLSYFCNLAEQAEKEIRGPDQARWQRRLAMWNDQFRLALEWAMETRQTETVLHLAGNLSLVWFRRSSLYEGREWLSRAASLPDAAQYPGLYGYILTQLAFHTWLQVGPKEAKPLAELSLSLARAHDERWNTAWCLTVLSLILISEGDFAAADATLNESKSLFRDLQDDWGYANAVVALGNGTYHRGDWQSSLLQHEESLSIFQRLGDRYFEEVALRFIGLIQAGHDSLATGIARLQDALILAQELNSRYEIAACLQHLGDAAWQGGDFARTIGLLQAARNVYDSIGAWQADAELNFEKQIQACRDPLGESAFLAALEKGRTMSMEQAIAFALEEKTSH